MKKNDIAAMDIKTLKETEQKIREELMRLRLKKGFEQLENPKRMRNLRKDLARVLTRVKQLEKAL
ncbi:MAG: 50S ribosomal protein L29 [Desulfurella sp.]|jgi:large subunit ribosomal protein L29|uniref:Large ribosomal subunit protein uL29 n=1 Tax=Desulfurella multipotens TaxID=79269 RepID=A0A1G6KH50_9BACT|nr:MULTISPECIES: 50S ribosomal protein L29 [Desulfurella]AHF96695.1 50S ribosomal protein L29 [Desulfurella acetivorans A63]HEX13996.1 50S ribosomal protein L29 [Desulfurella acetivorans]PMP67918.1 MAG: 50S ribosomal protein L29 [Desulfurella multipotens]PMP87071.1 MAG: 50S ribosomal protein L29 [Desulfurella sp.]SDC30141.1 large subunit ribosomal protein L29 [Desulfurella multipotens]